MSEQNDQRNRELARDFLQETGAVHVLQQAGLMDDDEFIDQVVLGLHDLAQSTANQPVVATRARIDRYNIKLKPAIWATAVAGVQIALSIATGGQLTGLDLSGHILALFTALTTALSKMSEEEVHIYEAITAIQRQKQQDGKVLEVKEAAPEEIAGRMSGKPEEFMASTLQEMVSKGVITRVFHGTRGPFYGIVF